jgi:hypothetical protein
LGHVAFKKSLLPPHVAAHDSSDYLPFMGVTPGAVSGWMVAALDWWEIADNS